MNTVKIYEEIVVIPTYEVGKPDKNPMFLEKRVYQGSSGKVYPYPTTETISKEKTDKEYKAVFLENQYLKVMILPELGGRIHRAYDKTNDYDFVYYNHVIKPALVGLVGPWISGGIEFNWPQHHRPTTFMEVDHKVIENADGSKSVLVNDVDQMYGTKGIAKFTLYPDKAYIEITGQLYNKTETPQTFLWWANPAVPVNDDTQSIFPPDVNFVMDHGKRDVSRFPIATGTYYKHDYSEGVDISRYKNIPVPTSYMAENSEYDFVGGYDYGKKAGIVHVADHHISPGKKQWTWGCGDFGKAWDRNLTDEDGPYIELMTGVYTDNQPDFTWLKPFEEKTFTQYFMPYKAVGMIKNATINAVVNMVVENESIYICAYATSVYGDAQIILKDNGKEVYRTKTTLSPIDTFEENVPYKASSEENIEVIITSGDKVLVSYKPKVQGIPEMVEPAKAIKEPNEIMTTEELFLSGQHIEQYRHATYLPDDYYLEGLKRDSGDIRINNAYGLLMYRRGNDVLAKKHFEKALERLIERNPNPYDSEVYYHLGLVSFYQEQYDDAFDYFYKATWSNEQQEMSFYYLALIACRRNEYSEALGFVNKGLVKNSHNIKARGLKASILRKLGQADLEFLNESLTTDPFDYLTMFEYYKATNDSVIINDMNRTMRNFHESYISIATDYAYAGMYAEAIEMLYECDDVQPLLYYYKGYFYHKQGDNEKALALYTEGEKCSAMYCFPNKLYDIKVLDHVGTLLSCCPKAKYYLGNLFYDKLQFEKAISLFEQSESMDANFPTVLRNLALGYYNKQNKKELALEKLEKAYSLDESDTRIFLELDQLYKKMAKPFDFRLEKYITHSDIINNRDDLYLEYVTLLNSMGKYKEAHDAIMSHHFSPWEGAEGRVPAQYKISLVELAKKAIFDKDFSTAKSLLEKALIYPENLGEGKLEGTKDNHIYYYLGICAKELGEDYQDYFVTACYGTDEPAGMMYYNDQPADMILYQGLAKNELSDIKSANARYYKLINFAENHLADIVKIDYFAVSLPDFLIFEEDLTIKNKAHCHYLLGLGQFGLGKYTEALTNFGKALEYDFNHQNSILYKNLTETVIESL